MKRVILLADDSATIQRLVLQTFADSSVEVVTVSNGDAAIRKFEELRPQLVLTDIYMPGKNGYEVCAHVKNHSELSETPVVLLAGAFDAFDEDAAQKVGAAAHITKPFEPRALVDLVMSLMGKESEIAAATTPAPVAEPAPAAEPVAAAPGPTVRENVPISIGVDRTDTSADLLGLADLFQPATVEGSSVLSVSDEEIERIADRVIQKLTTQVIESVAWDVVPGITTKVLQEELKRQS